MTRLEVQLVNGSGKKIGFGDRWLTHRVRKGLDGPILGSRHLGITIVCTDDKGRILIAHRRHKVFDKVWTLSGDTHPYRVKGRPEVETLSEAGRRCALDDLGVRIVGWKKALTVTYAARDPRDPRYCENELLHIMVARYDGPLRMNPKNVYELEWAELAEVSNEQAEDLEKEPIVRKYAPWVHAIFSLSTERVKSAFRII